jgi:hypothetical protein
MSTPMDTVPDASGHAPADTGPPDQSSHSHAQAGIPTGPDVTPRDIEVDRETAVAGLVGNIMGVIGQVQSSGGTRVLDAHILLHAAIGLMAAIRDKKMCKSLRKAVNGIDGIDDVLPGPKKPFNVPVDGLAGSFGVSVYTRPGDDDSIFVQPPLCETVKSDTGVQHPKFERTRRAATSTPHAEDAAEPDDAAEPVDATGPVGSEGTTTQGQGAGNVRPDSEGGNKKRHHYTSPTSSEDSLGEDTEDTTWGEDDDSDDSEESHGAKGVPPTQPAAAKNDSQHKTATQKTDNEASGPPQARPAIGKRQAAPTQRETKIGADMRTGRAVFARLVPCSPGQERLIEMRTLTRGLPIVRVLRVEGNALIGETVANSKREVFDVTINVRPGCLDESGRRMYYPMSCKFGKESFEAHSGWPLHEACKYPGRGFALVRDEMRQVVSRRLAHLWRCEKTGPMPFMAACAKSSVGGTRGEEARGPPKPRSYAAAAKGDSASGQGHGDATGGTAASGVATTGPSTKGRQAPPTTGGQNGVDTSQPKMSSTDAAIGKLQKDMAELKEQIITMLARFTPLPADMATDDESHV